jgi:hypothetical protein
MCLLYDSLDFTVEIKAVLEGRGFRPNFFGNFSFILLAALLSCFRQRPQTQKPPARSVGRCNVAARFTTRETCLIVKSTIELGTSSVSRN